MLTEQELGQYLFCGCSFEMQQQINIDGGGDSPCIHMQESLYFTTFYFKTTLIIRPPIFVPKFNFALYWIFMLRPPAIYDHIHMIPRVVLK